ncbi:MAG TPA: substrate-binding domain-containing protein [Acidimicrobiales bacterium]|nr:substrate-binding domain-containing protein [Acidimicrobiales bacterium]
MSSFTNNFSAMKSLKSLAKSGKGKVAVILPDTVSSARYTQFDAPYLTRALQTAGLSSSQFSIQNAQGSDSTQLTDAQSAVTAGASVLVVDPLDSGTGASIESYAKSHGVAVIDYDRLTLGGSRQYYVSFNNVTVGTLLGKGLVSCVAAWGVSKPNVAVMVGAPTDNNATLFAQGYNAVLNPLFSANKWTLAVRPAGTWDPPTAETEFQQALTAHPGINSVLMPNDETAAPVVTYLKTLNIPPNKFPVTGQDATTVGLQNVISGYQCGTVYKPIYVEAQAAAALALYLRAGKTPPKGLVNGSSTDTQTHAKVASVLLKPQWVTPNTVESTVIKDQFVTVSELCSGAFAADCTKFGIK